MSNTPNSATQQHRIATLLALVGQLRAMREAEGCLTFAETIARLSHAQSYGVLSDIAATLDSATAAEVDEELRTLWASALPAVATAA